MCRKMMSVFICQEIRKYANVLAFYVRTWQTLMNNWPGSDLVFQILFIHQKWTFWAFDLQWDFVYFTDPDTDGDVFQLASTLQYSTAVVWWTTILTNFKWFGSACEVWADETAEDYTSLMIHLENEPLAPVEKSRNPPQCLCWCGLFVLHHQLSRH